MRKERDICDQTTGGHARRSVRHPRQRDRVWLVTRPAPAPGVPTHHVSGALALERPPALTRRALTPRCVIVVERDPGLAAALASGLRGVVSPDISVQFVTGEDSCAPGDASGIFVVDTREARMDGDTAVSGTASALVVYITRDTSYDLYQRGASAGIVLREWRSLDEIIALLADTLGD